MLLSEEEQDFKEEVYNTPRKEKHEVESKPNMLYTITTIAASPRFGGWRTPIVCSSFEKAHEMLENNTGDLWETTYHLAVIEAVIPDLLYSTCINIERYFYRFNMDKEVYEPIECPKRYEMVVGFGIG